MKIAIDISAVIYGTGVSVYTENLVANLLKVDPKSKYILMGGSLRRRGELKAFAQRLAGDFETRFSFLPPTVADMLSNQLNLVSVESLVGEVGVYHSSDWAQFRSKAFKVTTVHDLAPILMPNQTHPKIVATHKRRLQKVIKEVDRIIVPSLATKKDLVNLGASENKIRVIHEALARDFSELDPKDIEEVRRKFKLHGNYSLSIGAVKRKNLQNIIPAFEKASSNADLSKHVVVGRGEAQDGRGVRFTGQVTDRELIALYAGASLLIYASSYEGFGLPILEAFAAGIPVVTSNVSSMPEVAGDAAVLVDPTSIDDISEGIIKAIESKKDLVKKGKQQLKKFSWEKAARETLAVYNEAENDK